MAGFTDFIPMQKELHQTKADLAAAHAEINRLTFALAEVEALELQHGAVIARLIEENRRLREALRPFASAWEIAQASGLTDMSRLGALARNETASVYFMRARAALSSTGEK